MSAVEVFFEAARPPEPKHGDIRHALRADTPPTA